MAGKEPSGTVHSATDGGIAGSHPTVVEAGVLVGPSTASEQNLVTAGLIPVACWRVDDVRFDFDSSFVLPAAFGHADPVGQDDDNKFLSGRRAAAIYGMLTRRDEVWEDLYSNKGVFTGTPPPATNGARARSKPC